MPESFEKDLDLYASIDDDLMTSAFLGENSIIENVIAQNNNEQSKEKHKKR